MAVPTRDAAARMLIDLGPPAWLSRHSVAVADIAAFLAGRVAGLGQPVDGSLVETAALLHDLDKALPHDHALHQLGHGHAGAAWLAGRDLAELAPAVADHPVTRLADDDHWHEWSRRATLEERIVAYADKRATQRLVPMRTRFAEWRRRFPDLGAEHDKAELRAKELEALVCAAAGIEPRDVRRRRWAAAALTAAGTASS